MKLVNKVQILFTFCNFHINSLSKGLNPTFSYYPITNQLDPDFNISMSCKPPLAWWVEYLPMAQEIVVQSQVEPYQRLKNGTWYLLAQHSVL